MNWITRTVVGAAVGILGALGARMLRPIPTSLLHWSYRSHRWGTDIMGRALCRTVLGRGVKAAGHCGKSELGPPVILVRLPWRVRIMMAIHY